MILTSGDIPGVALIELEVREDDRGFFARVYDREFFAAAGLESTVEQCNISFNRDRGTVRGMHFQSAAAPEAKLVRCLAGALLDQVVDMRPESVTYLQHFSIDLTAENRLALYIPPLFAHGYQTLVDGTEVFYQVSAPYNPAFECGLRFDDPALGLNWPIPVSRISAKDAAWPLLTS